MLGGGGGGYLSGGSERRCRARLAAAGRGGAAAAAVLVPLCAVRGRPALLFTLRSSALRGPHSGDVSFPGGKRDPADGDAVATALRETREELGLGLGAQRVWGLLPAVPDRQGMMVAPVLANLGPLEDVTLTPNPQEVEEVFTVPLAHLLQAQNQGYTHFRSKGRYSHTLPVFLNGPHRVWGLTAVITELTLELLAPDLYRRKTRQPWEQRTFQKPLGRENSTEPQSRDFWSRHPGGNYVGPELACTS
ncbi:mitochondrial coenzyme A diphosphatase NUDT8 [Struthio camelus]|uniref:mitochondrial coenzyme A diphosphatase NUDT8 n=1 Tax=Struthio camelus TaxID=8801 RepID=UPI003603F486